MNSLESNSKHLWGRALLLTGIFSFVLAGPSEAKKDSFPITNPETITEIVEDNDLFKKSEYAYRFQEKDVNYWAKKGLTQSELEKQFKARRTVRKLAKKTGYKVASSDGKLTAGALSYWSEKLLSVDHPNQIEHEFKELLSTQDIMIRQSQLKGKSDKALKDESEIKKLARQYGLYKPNEFAWTFGEGDIVWYSLQGMDRDEIEKDFQAKAIVRDLARSTGYRVVGSSGELNSGELSYWAEFLYKGSMKPEQPPSLSCSCVRSSARAHHRIAATRQQPVERLLGGIERVCLGVVAP